MTAAPPRQELRRPPLDSAGEARRAAEALSRRLEANGFAGWDPYDALSSPLVRGLARTRRLRQAAIQALKWSPVNVRPLLGVPRMQHTKGLALLASAYARLALLPGGDAYRGLAREIANLLAARALPSGDGVGWGYDFDVQTRWAYYPRGHANAVATSFAAHALLDVAELTGDGGPRELARRAVDFASSGLYVRDGDGVFFAYYDGSTTPIHNASVLIASVVARCGGEAERALAREAVRYTVERQRADGAWPYGEAAGLEWVDGFHTAYVLERLADWDGVEPSADVAAAITRGTEFYVERLFDADGAPRATVESRYPIDIHGASSGVTALLRVRAYSDAAVPAAERVLRWTLGNMRRGDGRFAFRRHRFLRNSLPYIRWNDGHMLLALANYALAAEGADG